MFDSKTEDSRKCRVCIYNANCTVLSIKFKSHLENLKDLILLHTLFRKQWHMWTRSWTSSIDEWRQTKCYIRPRVQVSQQTDWCVVPLHYGLNSKRITEYTNCFTLLVNKRSLVLAQKTRNFRYFPTIVLVFSWWYYSICESTFYNSTFYDSTLLCYEFLSRIASSVLRVKCYQRGSCVGGPSAFNSPFEHGSRSHNIRPQDNHLSGLSISLAKLGAQLSISTVKSLVWLGCDLSSQTPVLVASALPLH